MRAAVLGLLALTASSAPAQPAPDSAAVTVRPPPPVVDTVSLPSPRGAVTRALALPGWGQVYNREPVKAPVAAALVAGSVAYAVFQQRRYLLYRRSAFYAGCVQDAARDVCTDDAVAAALDEWEETGSPSFAAVSPLRDRVRGQRDVSFLVVGVAYALQALDAYVSAELAGFDVSEDLSVRVTPVPSGAALGLRVSL